jgi:hypothetical protein
MHNPKILCENFEKDDDRLNFMEEEELQALSLCVSEDCRGSLLITQSPINYLRLNNLITFLLDRRALRPRRSDVEGGWPGPLGPLAQHTILHSVHSWACRLSRHNRSSKGGSKEKSEAHRW